MGGCSIGAALRATKELALGLCCPRLAGILQRMGCLLLGMPAFSSACRHSTRMQFGPSACHTGTWTPDSQRHTRLSAALSLGQAQRLTPALACPQVAVSNDGTIFVADGYCNSRVVSFTSNGTFQAQFELPGSAALAVPHSLVLDECRNTLYVADRESSKVHSFDLGSHQLTGVAPQS